MTHILKCGSCGCYDIEQRCVCGGELVNPKPPKFSPDDKYASYRRKVKYGKNE